MSLEDVIHKKGASQGAVHRFLPATRSPLTRRTRAVLMVGAGGIGCELLKTLVLTGFTDIEMVRPGRRLAPSRSPCSQAAVRRAPQRADAALRTPGGHGHH